MMEDRELIENARRLLGSRVPPMDPVKMRRFVESCAGYADLFQKLRAEHGSPLYVVDRGGLVRDLNRLADAFAALPGEVKIFYALKSNNMQEIADILCGAGAGLDVSSGLELSMALKAGARSIIFSGPGKTDGELSAAVDNADRVILMIDSFGELERLDRITRKRGIRVRAGVRLTTQPGGLWGRFGISLDDLGEFLEKADRYPFIILEGLQFHTSWNLKPQAQADFIGRLGTALARLPGYLLFDMAFIDIGGGYWPEHGEWLRAAGTPAGRLRSMLGPDRQDVHSAYLLEGTRIEEFAARIGAALDESLPDDIDCRFFIEPGRWLCHQNMHILMTAVDIKGEGTVITDAGTGAVGWERFEHDYFPLVNLSDPGTRERKCGVFGPLCTPHDVWGWSYFGEGIRRGDLILVPAQGAYTYSLRQEFIKPLPGKTVVAGPLELRWTE